MANAKFNFDNFALNLPDAFAKVEDSNNYKLLLVEKHIYDAISNIFQGIYDMTDIDKATGAALDLHGERQQLKRGSSDDTQYRIRIKGKIAQSLCDGSRDSVAAALAYILSGDTSQVQLKSGTQPYTVDLLGIPLKLLYEADFTPEQINKLIEELLPESVRLNEIQYVGTFTYSSIDTQGEYAPDTGYGDIEQTTGGYYGLIGGYK